MGEQENKNHADQADFDSYIKLVDESKMLIGDKSSCRRLLSTAFANTNGDPPEVKQKKMCHFDWELSKQIVEIRVLMSELVRSAARKDAPPADAAAAPKGKLERIFSALSGWKNQIAAVLIAYACAPHGVEIVQAIGGLIK